MKASQRYGSKGAQTPSALQLVVARGDPDLAAMLDPDLRRAQHMAGGMKGDADAASAENVAIGDGLDGDVRAEPLSQDGRAVALADVKLSAGARVIAMAVRDQRPADRAPGVNVEIAWLTIQAILCDNDKVHGTG